nr:MAG TPA: hypothetical protein [Caudoviricetes sp.]
MSPVPSLGGAGFVVQKRGKTSDTTIIHAHHLSTSNRLDEFQ